MEKQNVGRSNFRITKQVDDYIPTPERPIDQIRS